MKATSWAILCWVVPCAFVGCHDVDGIVRFDGSEPDGGVRDSSTDAVADTGVGDTGVDDTGVDDTGGDTAIGDSRADTSMPDTLPRLSRDFGEEFQGMGVARLGDGYLVVGRNAAVPMDRRALATYITDEASSGWANEYGQAGSSETYFDAVEAGEEALATGFIDPDPSESGDQAVLFARFAESGLRDHRTYDVPGDSRGFAILPLESRVIVAGRIGNRPALFLADMSFSDAVARRVNVVPGQFQAVWAGDDTIIAVGNDETNPGNTAYIAVFDLAAVDPAPTLRWIRTLQGAGVVYRLMAVTSDGESFTVVGRRDNQGLRIRMSLTMPVARLDTNDAAYEFRDVVVEGESERYAGVGTDTGMDVGQYDMFVADDAGDRMTLHYIEGTRPAGFTGHALAPSPGGALMSRTTDGSTIVISSIEMRADSVACATPVEGTWRPITDVPMLITTTPDALEPVTMTSVEIDLHETPVMPAPFVTAYCAE